MSRLMEAFSYISRLLGKNLKKLIEDACGREAKQRTLYGGLMLKWMRNQSIVFRYFLERLCFMAQQRESRQKRLERKQPKTKEQLKQ
jgi:hypothetical protein